MPTSIFTVFMCLYRQLKIILLRRYKKQLRSIFILMLLKLPMLISILLLVRILVFPKYCFLLIKKVFLCFIRV